ncbi:LysR family transcriptional regulator [Streptomyces sp. NBC_00525]|uniref:LysR family transcriptional regulator n=1 Tax=Streptomyces sp. NBC_00525 TaxID=2903660 RepID=UPI002E824956|nr:LysR family transcriptional regulator [Streptomyces sp. NBC_00525]WUC96882.1 LysR family transcriptional regulator [Streptomyces sp. NBC_00525]
MSETGVGDHQGGWADELSGRQGPSLDLRLLPALDALLQEGSVTGAAERLALSPPAMSRTLAKIRLALGDPVLVRAGRGLVPTPRALELQPRVRALLWEAELLLSPSPQKDLSRVSRMLTIVADEAYAAVLAPKLLSRASVEVPMARFAFTVESTHGSAPLREGSVDIEIGVIDEPSPELRIEPLFQDRFTGVARAGHPLLAAEVTAEAFASARHVSVSRKGRMAGPIDTALHALGLHREVIASVPNYGEALLMIPTGDLVTAMPHSVAAGARRSVNVELFDLPVATEPISICQAWHPRHETEPVHMWLREAVRAALTHPVSSGPPPSCAPRAGR